MEKSSSIYYKRLRTRQWGGANQMAIFPKMENIKIQVYSHGMPCQTYEFQGEDENNKSTINAL
eukprot:8227973-Heterocapsa_arctica.AAC.1